MKLMLSNMWPNYIDFPNFLSPSYTGDIITLCTGLKLLPIDNNAMLGVAQFMVYFRGTHCNVKKALYINFLKNTNFFHNSVISTNNDGGPG